MDIVLDSDSLTFIDSLDTVKDVKDAAADTTSISSTTSTSPASPASDEVWDGIADALECWTQRILDAETRHSQSDDFHQRVEESLTRQHLDGFLNAHDLRYIAELWKQLLDASSSYAIDCDFMKRDILTLLLELHSLRPISSSLFIETSLKL